MVNLDRINEAYRNADNFIYNTSRHLEKKLFGPILASDANLRKASLYTALWFVLVANGCASGGPRNDTALNNAASKAVESASSNSIDSKIAESIVEQYIPPPRVLYHDVEGTIKKREVIKEPKDLFGYITETLILAGRTARFRNPDWEAYDPYCYRVRLSVESTDGDLYSITAGIYLSEARAEKDVKRYAKKYKKNKFRGRILGPEKEKDGTISGWLLQKEVTPREFDERGFPR